MKIYAFDDRLESATLVDQYSYMSLLRKGGGGQRTVAVAQGNSENIQNVKLPENTRKSVSLQNLRKPESPALSGGAGWTR